MKSLKIKDPKTQRYVATLQPKQKLELVISDDNISVNITGMLLQNISIYTNEQHQRVFVIEPIPNILKHSFVSNHYLGEIIVGTEHSVLVYLQSTLLNKNTLTIINPFQESLRIKPYHIIEFMYCSDYDRNLTWSWTYPSRGVAIDISELSYKKTVSGVTTTKKYEETYYAHPRDIFDKDSVIHHFWFKLTNGLLREIQDNPSRNVEIGRLSIEGFNDINEPDECFVDIYCDLLPKWTSEKKSKKKVNNYYSSYEHDNYDDDYYIHRVSSYNSSSYYNYYNNSNNHRLSHQCAKVNFSIIPIENIYDGCKTVALKDLEVEVKSEINENMYSLGWEGY